jgi:hypothetical protein
MLKKWSLGLDRAIADAASAPIAVVDAVVIIVEVEVEVTVLGGPINPIKGGTIGYFEFLLLLPLPLLLLFMFRFVLFVLLFVSNNVAALFGLCRLKSESFTSSIPADNALSSGIDSFCFGRWREEEAVVVELLLFNSPLVTVEVRLLTPLRAVGCLLFECPPPLLLLAVIARLMLPLLPRRPIGGSEG